MSIMEISPPELQAQRHAVTVIDVREPAEVAICALKGALVIPLGQLPARLSEIPADKPIVTLCHHGMRSLHAAQLLAAKGITNVVSLKGGIDAWAREVEPKMARY
jgi:rhodanese-related sulfurtransferase